MSDAAPGSRLPTADEALHTTLDMAFDDAVPFVRIEHELADFETVQVTRLDEMIEGMLGHDLVHVHHVSATKAIRDLGCAPADCDDAVDEADVGRVRELMTVVWENIEEHGRDRGPEQ